MSATVLDFQAAVRRRNGINRRCDGHDAIAQAVMEHFKAYPITVIERAIIAAQSCLADGHGFISAMDVAMRVAAGDTSARSQHVIDAHLETNIDQVWRRNAHRIIALMSISERMIRAYLQGSSEIEIGGAITRANRVLLGDGTLSAAIYHAININTANL